MRLRAVPEASELMSLGTIDVIGFGVTSGSFSEQAENILEWAARRESRVILVANVHMLMEAHADPTFATVFRNADQVLPDGMPLVWMMNATRKANQVRMAGLDVMRTLFQGAGERSLNVFLLGSTIDVLEDIQARARKDFPGISIVGIESPPFREPTPDEDARLVQAIHESGAHLVFVALGCPKQERWMEAHRNRVQAVMVGLGGAFPVYAGFVRHAPAWVRKAGLEWAFRLILEPRRLWRRYWSTNLPFIGLAVRQLLTVRRSSKR